MPKKTKAQKIAAQKRRTNGRDAPIPKTRLIPSRSDPLNKESQLNMELGSVARERAAILGAADYALRKTFPDNYHRRCYYAAAVISDHLNKMNLNSYITGGPGLFPSTSNVGGGWDGFSESTTIADPHQWAATADNPIIDVMTTYDMYKIEGGKGMDVRPAIWWDSKLMPFYLLGYREDSRGHPDSCFADDGTRDNFRRVKESFEEGMLKGTLLSNPIISCHNDIIELARSGFAWARHVLINSDYLHQQIQNLRKGFKPRLFP